MSGPWLPKGESPGEGHYFARSPEGFHGFAMFGEDECFAVLQQNPAGGDFKLIEYPSWKELEGWTFAPATPPPGWDLVEALKEEQGHWQEWEKESPGMGFSARAEGLGDATDIAIDYLAGRPRKP